MSAELRFVRLVPLSITLFLFSSATIAQTSVPATRATARAKSQYESFAMTKPGDVARGKALFFDDSKLACSKCHTVDSKGGKAGPDLFSIGDKFGRRDLVESILSPSATIAVGYSTTLVKTKSGDVIEGVLKEATDEAIGLMGADAKLIRIKTADIDQRRTTDVSLMPENLQAGLTTQEFADLIEYLASLKVPATAAFLSQGMPIDIPEIAKPIALVPFIQPENKFTHPVWFGPVPGAANVFAVVEHESGKIWILDKSTSAEFKSVLVDTGKFQTGTRGLLGMVFHPKYATNHRYFFVKHLVDGSGHYTSNLMEAEAAADLKHNSGKPPRVVLKIDDSANVHYGGGLAFGPDGYLYMGMGDSGPQGDPNGNAQNMSKPLGKMLRMDVDHPDGDKLYSIPADNPFVGRSDVRPEIWAYGFREPWRFSFDPLTNDLWVGDVGQDLYEEVDIARKGENYGWNVYEGFAPYSNRTRRDAEHYVPPIFAYTRKYGASVTGGFVYRADPKSSFYGVYIFGDYQNFRLFALTQENRTLKKVRQIGKPPEHPVSFGRDEHGELYMVGYEGMIFKMDLSAGEFR
ncbi:MAG TPA: PQQ-dependent sugar dehydrogenase [Humisphaera sp.]|jgi:putative heme-binding domain-containing protein|nr:PQQ-dependent sugar dehydrogenase [Humisphaera sp.]